jgi:hypothetical protein
MDQNSADSGFSYLDRVGLAAMKLDAPRYPIAVSLFSAIGVTVIAQSLTDLIHQFQSDIRRPVADGLVQDTAFSKRLKHSLDLRLLEIFRNYRITC